MRQVTGGDTDVTTYFALRLTADGTAATGLTITNMDLQYVRSGAAPSAKVDATALGSTGAAHGDNQAIEIDATDQPGLYRVDWPDAAFAAGVPEVVLTVKVATAFTEHLAVLIDAPVNVTKIVAGATAAANLKTAGDNYSATRGLTGTAVPAAAADAVGGLPISDAGGLDLDNLLKNAGYEHGAIWVDTNASNTNTVSFVDGTAVNPVSTMAAANTLAAALGTNILYLVAGSSITLVQAHNFWTFIGYGATIALGGQSINGAVFFGAKINGNDDGSNTNRVRYMDCDVDGSTLGQFIMCRCRLTAGTLTLAEAGTYFMDACYSGVAGTGTPALDFGAGLNASNLNMRHYSGGIEIENMGAGTGSYNMSLEGHGQLIINANCSATSTVAIRGNFTITDNAGGAVTLSDDARITRSEIADDVHDEATAGHTGAGTFGLQLKTVVDTIATDAARLTAVRAAVLTDWINGGRLDVLLDAIKVVTDAITTTGAGLTDLGGMSTAMKAEVKSEVNGAIDTAIPELGVATPATTPTIRTGLMLMYMALLNQLIVQTSGTDALEIYNNAGVKIASKLITDAAGDYTEAKMA